MKKLKILLLLIIFISVSFYLFYREGFLPVNKLSKETKTFIIKSGEPLDTITNNLASDGLIRNKIVFYLVVKKLGLERKIQAGEFKISENMNAEQVAINLTHGSIDTSITLIEGMRKEEMAQIISKTLDIPEIEIMSKAKEGYIFPDTYQVPKNASSDVVLTIIKNNQKFVKAFQNIKKQTKLTEKQALILASLVEREARQPSTREKIAGIILKRYLANWPLDLDASLQYILGYQANEKSWWKKSITDEDKNIDSPFNTYKNKGLPPEPVCSPSLSSLEAVINADPSTPYWFYLTDNNGVMHYAVTLEEHEANIQKYLR
ncbi:endolytic transglycosylase MltG [Candidatus Roizmanbacteria bacterium CG_4_8_14_3_um_filter_34_9]|uniref:Endolytic murein transglycosylase n=3 Tax=Candidatus Roizmaniibacteriota TaxID=1752723 RepID=A0A2M6YUQ3_9BACT|nr:MAG: endolytic transglycosylase MltG [Candidatus Roizmanbacteria bacterium CG07_land_8_20_14_0_80_34_15]PIW73357.1 MAG: endolytic transglycosylase MltG [Candidatus Roizmanbacteria bacterium CG_4_8_14_3_um_filter_34_9]